MVTKTIENLQIMDLKLIKISQIVDQRKTLYMHQTNQNKKLFDLHREKLSLTMVTMVTRKNLFSLDAVSKNCQKIISSVYIQEHWFYTNWPNFVKWLWSNPEKFFLKARVPLFPKPWDKKISNFCMFYPEMVINSSLLISAYTFLVKVNKTSSAAFNYMIWMDYKPSFWLTTKS